MTGTGLMLRIMIQAQRRRLVVWVVALVGILAFTAISVARLYDTPAKVQSYGEAVVSNALVAINGRVRGIDSLGGVIQDEFNFMASLLLPLVGIALIASMTRAQEESGRLEALLSGRIDRRAPVAAALMLVVGAVTVMDLGFVIALSVAGIDFGPAVLYSLSVGMVSLVFAALAAVFAQVVLHSRSVYTLGFAVVGLSYGLRGIGDVKDTFWVWLSPLGWLEETAAFADTPRWWVLLIPLAAAVGLAALAVLLAGRRDLGSAPYRQGPGANSASGWLVRPLGLALQVQRGSLLGWMMGSLALAAVMGALTPELVDAILGNSSLSLAMGLSGEDTAHGVLALTQVYLALIACGYVVQTVGTLRREEVGGRLEPMLAGSVGRLRWLGAQLVVVLGGLVLVVAASAVVFGATTALSTGGSGDFGTLLAAGLAYLPAELVVAGLAALLYGLMPWAFPVAWAVFGAITAIGLLGPGLRLSAWMLDVSPLTHVGNPPEGDISPPTLAWLILVALGLMTAAFAGFQRRRVPQG